METSQVYKGYTISYSSITGNTEVSDGFTEVALFVRMGESKGLRKAKEYIDNLENKKNVRIKIRSIRRTTRN